MIGAVDSLAADALSLLHLRSTASYSGTAIDSQETLAFSALTGVRSMNGVLLLDSAAEGYDRMMSGQARFRVVLTTGG